MSTIKKQIEKINGTGKKVLSIFLTAGYPNKKNFLETAKAIIENGADMLEIGVPFADSLADGPVIQSSYIESLKQNITLTDTLKFIEEIKNFASIPVLLMSSANPIYKYGIDNFTVNARSSGVDGLIIPDIPLEEYSDFFDSRFNGLDIILLTTPTSSEIRIKQIDKLSSGFVYCVSVVGTTGIRTKFDDKVLINLERTYSNLTNNKMLIGFGIKNYEDVKRFSPYCDGVIVGSAVVKSLSEDDKQFSNTIKLIKELSSAC